MFNCVSAKLYAACESEAQMSWVQEQRNDNDLVTLSLEANVSSIGGAAFGSSRIKVELC